VRRALRLPWAGSALPLLFSVVAAPLAGAGDLAEHTVREDLARYRQLLQSVCAGEPGTTAELHALAEHLCAAHARCDTKLVAAYYTELSPAQRARGVADEAEFAALHEIAYRAGHEGLAPDETWNEVRLELELELLALAARVRTRADYVPAGLALSLLARLEADRARSAEALGSGEREELLEHARSHATEARAIFERAGQLARTLEPVWVLAKVAHTRGLDTLARAGFEECRALAARFGNDDFRERALIGLVALARDGGAVERVATLLGELATFRTPEESWPLAREHAIRLLSADRAEAALALLVRLEPRDNSYEGEWRTLLSSAFLRTGDLRSARRELDFLGEPSGEAGVIARATLDLADGRAGDVLTALGEPGAFARWSVRGRAHACALLGEAHLTSGRADEARVWLERALGHAESWRARQDEAPRVGGFRESGYPERGLHDRGPADSGPAEGAYRENIDSGSIIGEWLGLHTVVLLARAHAMLGGALEAARVIEEFQSRGMRDGASSPSVSADDILAWAREFDVGLVTWGIGPDTSVVAHVDADGHAWAAPIEQGRRACEDAVRRLREAAIAGDSERTRELARELGRALFPDELVERLTAPEGGARVLLLLHGPLESLPMTLLELDGVVFDERFTPLVLPGLPPLAGGVGFARAAGAGGEEWTLLGSPLSGSGAASGQLALPGASRELAALARMYPHASLHSGAMFDRPALEDALRGVRPLHIATHLVRAESCGGERLAPVGLELSGGQVMCAEEIRAIGPRLPLVVLTACDTAGGRFVDAEGLHGVSRAFLEPGTRNLIATLWPVEDEAARSFALHLHAALSAGAAPSQAAREARAALRAEGRSAADWAAFRFMGRD